MATRVNKTNATQPVGATGLKTTWGGINDDFLLEWRGSNKIKRVKEMLLNSPVVAGLRLAIEMPIRDVDWMLVSKKGENDPRIDLYDESLANLSHSWNDHIIDALLFPFYGWSLFSLNYERKNGRLLWRNFLPLGHDTIERWLIDNDGGLAGVQQYSWVYPQPIPIDRLILYRFRRNRNNPEGESILRPGWIPYYYTKNLQQIEAIAYERNGAGYPYVQAPEGADMTEGGTDYETAHKTVRNMRIDEQSGLVLPFGWDAGFKNPGSGAGSFADFDKPISRYEKRMLLSALSQFLMLGMDNVGALATFEGSTDFFTMLVNSLADIIAETFFKYAVTRLLELNGYDTDGLSFSHSPAGNIDEAKVGGLLKDLSALFTWSDQDEDWLRQLLRMPERTEERPSNPVTKPAGGNQDDGQMTAHLHGREDFQMATTGDRETDGRIERHYDELQELTRLALEGEIGRGEFEARMRDAVTAALLLAYLMAGGSPQNEEAQRAIQQQEAKSAVAITRLADDIYSGRYNARTADEALPGRPPQTAQEGWEKLKNRLLLWVGTMASMFWLGHNYSPDGQVTETWRLGRTEQHCETCAALDGVTLTRAEWARLGYYPRSPQLACGGFHCDCSRSPEGLPSDGIQSVMVR